MPTIRFFCIMCGTALEGTSDSRADVIACPSCAHHVSVPQPARIPCAADGSGPVFPPGVLELSVKFLCTSCRSPLRADARWEGRTVACPVCSDKTIVPRWSGVARWPRAPDAGKNAPGTTGSEVVHLSADEIEFLSTTATGAGTSGANT